MTVKSIVKQEKLIHHNRKNYIPAAMTMRELDCYHSIRLTHLANLEWKRVSDHSVPSKGFVMMFKGSKG